VCCSVLQCVAVYAVTHVINCVRACESSDQLANQACVSVSVFACDFVLCNTNVKDKLDLPAKQVVNQSVNCECACTSRYQLANPCN